MSDATATHARLAQETLELRSMIISRRLDLPFGVALIADDLASVYDLNFMAVTRPVSAGILLTSVDRIAAEAGWKHRRLEIDDPRIADNLRGALTDAGYEEERLETMVLDHDAYLRAPAGPPTSRKADVVAIAAQLDLARTVTSQEPWADSQEIVDQMIERERRLGQTGRARAVIAPPDVPVSRCLLLTHAGGELTEIDAVSTLAEHRGQRWSQTVMRRAIAEAHTKGTAEIVLVADADDWPREWYARLGFRTVGRSSAFARRPDGEDCDREDEPGS
jgi:ribosomal protein S18 acetylase RimI-like enzyme